MEPPALALMLPAAQLVHTDEPTRLTCPIMQEVQEDSPGLAEIWPALHRWHLLPRREE